MSPKLSCHCYYSLFFILSSYLSSFFFFCFSCAHRGSFSSLFNTFPFSLGQMGVSIWCHLKWWDSENRFWTIFCQYYGKISNCIFHVHLQKLHKMQIRFMSDLFCIYIVTIAVASRHFMLFPLIIIYHLIIAKCFLQSENFINNPFALSLFFCTLACESIKHLSSYIR